MFPQTARRQVIAEAPQSFGEFPGWSISLLDCKVSYEFEKLTVGLLVLLTAAGIGGWILWNYMLGSMV
jgi:hypothetical protein